MKRTVHEHNFRVQGRVWYAVRGAIAAPQASLKCEQCFWAVYYLYLRSQTAAASLKLPRSSTVQCGLNSCVPK